MLRTGRPPSRHGHETTGDLSYLHAGKSVSRLPFPVPAGLVAPAFDSEPDRRVSRHRTAMRNGATLDQSDCSLLYLDYYPGPLATLSTWSGELLRAACELCGLRPLKTMPMSGTSTHRGLCPGSTGAKVHAMASVEMIWKRTETSGAISSGGRCGGVNGCTVRQGRHHARWD